MTLVEVYFIPEFIRYKTHYFSKALLFQFILTTSAIVAAFLTAFKSYGFWNQTLSGLYQPNVTYDYSLITNFISSSNNVYSWSTFRQFNTLQANAITSLPTIFVREEDTNQDGKFDRLYLNVSFTPPSSAEYIVGVQLLMFFHYELYGYSYLVMNALALVDFSSKVKGSALFYIADLILYQKQSLASFGLDNTFNTSIVPSNSLSASDYDLGAIFKNYSQRNNTLQLNQIYPVWIPVVSTAMDNTFFANVTLNYPFQRIIFQAPFWYMLKWAWIQFVSVLFIFFFVISRVKKFVFREQIVNTVVEMPFVKKNQ